MARLKNMRERLYVEESFSIVPLEQGRALDRSEIHQEFVNNTEGVLRIVGFRLDAVIDDGPEGFARGFAHLLAGSTFFFDPGSRSNGPFHFMAGLIALGVEQERIDADIPAMRHGVIIVDPDFQLPMRQGYKMRLRYDGPPIPLAFLRVLALAIRHRDIQ